MKKIISSLICLIFSINTSFAIEICGDLVQGQVVEVLDNKETYLYAFDRDASLEQNIKGQKFSISSGAWDIQNLTGVQQNKVTPSKKDEFAINFEREAIKKAYAKTVIIPYWKNGFIMPVVGRLSGQYGGQRIMNGVPLNHHNGLDIAKIEGSVIKASGGGEVVLAAPNLFYSGNVIIINHGGGLNTIYAHLKEINVLEGDVVTQGQIIGLVGKTGRVTGAHLHWGANLNGIKFNPLSLLTLGKNQEKCFKL